MKIAFTLCSNNYLAQAKTLGDTFLDFHSDFKFIIGLVDKYDKNFDYSYFNKFELIPVEDINIDNLDDLISKYNVVELNTAVKPSYFHYLFKTFEPENVIYLDPDIMVLSRFEELINLLDSYNIVITPHITKPIDDEFAPTDYHTLRGGVFNLGFIALSNYNNVKKFLVWWHERVIKYGYSNFTLNMFYDQLWINYVPVMFDNHYILMHPGYNMANWNLHERNFSFDQDGNYLVNENYPLRFFHFSSFNYNKPDIISRHHTRYNFVLRPDLIHIFESYFLKLKNNSIEVIQLIPIHYYPKPSRIDNENKIKSFLIKVYKRLKLTTKVLIRGHV